MFVKPASRIVAGGAPQILVVRDPVTRRPLPPEGAEVPETTYWHRRLRDGDVLAAAAPAHS